jgi:hypothetical protein
MGGVFERGTAAARANMPWGSASSIALHLLLIGTLLLVSPVRPIIAPPPQPVSVEIVTQQQFEALQAPDEAPVPVAVPAPTEAPIASTPDDGIAVPAPAPQKTYVATQLYATSMLKEPGMARVRQALRTVSNSERVVQLCNIEGLEQIRRTSPGFVPDTMVAYAMADMVAAGRTLNAAGGAFRSRRKWFGIAFTCSVAADYSGVTAFAFQLGEPIPEDLWEMHNLNAADADE